MRVEFSRTLGVWIVGAISDQTISFTTSSPSTLQATRVDFDHSENVSGGPHTSINILVSIKVEVFTKNQEDVGDGSNADSGGSPTNITASAVGRTTTEWYSTGTVGLKEMVRYRFTITGTDVSDWVLFRMLSPIWFNAVKG